MNRVLVVFSDELLAQVDAARGLASRSAWIRSWCEHGVRVENEWPAVEEAVAPLVPADEVDWQAMALRGPIPTLNEFDAYKAKPKGPFRCPDCLDPTPHERGDCPAYQPSEPKPKARRKKVTVGDLESDEPIDLMVALKASVDAMKAATTQTPARCNRGACTGTINPVSGRCLHCNQTPLKEPK